MTEKIQYYLPDLAHALGIGKIIDIHVAEQNGQQVLRIECEKAEKSEYKTVKANGTKKRNGTQGSGAKQSKTLGDKVVAGVKTWWNDKKEAPWSREFGK